MDVQATTTTSAVLPPLPPPNTPQQSAPDPISSGPVNGTGAFPQPGSIPVVSGTDTGSKSAGGGADVIGPTPGLATLPASGSKAPVSLERTLPSGVAKLYNAAEQNVSVSFHIERNPNEIVTVFTDKQTGKVIVQFPSETLIALAKFFDTLDGGVVNKKV